MTKDLHLEPLGVCPSCGTLCHIYGGTKMQRVYYPAHTEVLQWHEARYTEAIKEIVALKLALNSTIVQFGDEKQCR